MTNHREAISYTGRTTAKQRAVVYTVVIVLITAFTIFLFRLWGDLNEGVTPEQAVKEGFNW